MARVLGIDYGEKRTGLSVTDPLQIIVSPLVGIDTSKALDYINNYLEKEEVEKIVIGIPTFGDGTQMPIHKSIKKFISKIKSMHSSIEIDTIEEAFTSQIAKQVIRQSGVKKMKRRDKYLIDKMSAVIILQQYLEHI